MEYLNTYLKTLEITGDKSENTIHAYSSDLKRFIQFVEDYTGRGLLAGDINSEIIKKFLDSEKNKGFAASTLHRRKISLSQFLIFLSKTGNFSKKEVNEVLKWGQNLWKEIYHREIQYLYDEDVTCLFSALTKADTAKTIRDTSIISMMLETGLSIGKIISIDIDDLDLKRAVVKISNNETYYKLSIKKSMEFINQYVLDGRKQFAHSTDERALFVSQMGGRISRQGIWQMVKEWGIKANLNANLSPRILRNTHIKMMLQEGLPTAEIQRKLGHRNRYSTRVLIRKMNRNK
jgi:integrase/recombinase XerD